MPVMKLDNPFLLGITLWIRDYGLELLVLGLPFLFGIGSVLTSDEGATQVSSWIVDSPESFGSEARDRIAADRYERVFKAEKEHWQLVGARTMTVTTPLFLLVSLLHVFRTKRLTNLGKEVEDLRGQVTGWEEFALVAADGAALTLAHALGFKAGAANWERVTIYSHDPEGYFVPFARYSRNEAFIRKGRLNYPHDQGCIARAWQHGRFFANDFPDYETDPEAYFARAAEEGLNRETVEKFSMKSRLYFGWRVRNLSDTKSLAVVVVESLDAARYSEDTLNWHFKRQDRFLSTYVELIAPKLPKVTNARNAGY